MAATPSPFQMTGKTLSQRHPATHQNSQTALTSITQSIQQAALIGLQDKDVYSCTHCVSVTDYLSVGEY